MNILERKKIAFFGKIFFDLHITGDPLLDQYWQRLTLSMNSSVEIDGVMLESLDQKIHFARAKLEQYKRDREV